VAALFNKYFLDSEYVSWGSFPLLQPWMLHLVVLDWSLNQEGRWCKEQKKEKLLANIRVMHPLHKHFAPVSTSTLRKDASPSETHYLNMRIHVCRSNEAHASS
jgi:hypothetical protein